MTRFFRLLPLSSIFFLASSLITFDGRANLGLQIAKKIREANRGFGGDISETRMAVIDAHGRKIERLMEIKTIEVEGDGNRSLMTFLFPKDVKGTKMLTWEHGESDDKQWLYLPSLKRVKKIYGSNRSSSFMGSEFTYEDLASGQEVKKYNYKFLSKIEGKSWTIERRSKGKSYYTKAIVTYSIDYMNPIEIKYYDKRNKVQKVSTFSNWKKYKVGQKEFWYAHQVEMNNIQTNRRSLLIWDNKKFVSSLKGKDFRKSSLR